jgi:hypothetical protein
VLVMQLQHRSGRPTEHEREVVERLDRLERSMDARRGPEQR